MTFTLAATTCLCIHPVPEHGICLECGGNSEPCMCRECYPRCEVYSPAEVAAAKQASREHDARDLASGAKTAAQLQRENLLTFGLRCRVRLR